MSQREYWSEAMEKRYHRRRLELWPKLPLKGHFFKKKLIFLDIDFLVSTKYLNFPLKNMLYSFFEVFL